MARAGYDMTEDIYYFDRQVEQGEDHLVKIRKNIDEKQKKGISLMVWKELIEYKLGITAANRWVAEVSRCPISSNVYVY